MGWYYIYVIYIVFIYDPNAWYTDVVLLTCILKKLFIAAVSPVLIASFIWSSASSYKKIKEKMDKTKNYKFGIQQGVRVHI